jgi:hypothetical protein
MFTSAFLPRFFDEYESLDWRELLRDGTDNPAVEWAGIRIFTPDCAYFIVDFSIVQGGAPGLKE